MANHGSGTDLFDTRLSGHYNRPNKSLIRTSKTGSLNFIIQNEEVEKGWKKGEIALPVEFRDLDAVHVLPFVDLERLLFILVTRSILLSNTQYSLLLQTTEGRLLNLGSDWIGARVEYRKKALCFSEMIAADIEYTNLWGSNNDECEYYVNEFVYNDRIYLQNFVFDTAFELEMNFDKFELEFKQLEENQKMHVTSNPYFAFHDDVFPAFAKNQVSQDKFSPQISHGITLIPDNYFNSLQFFNHISTIIFDPVGICAFSFILKMVENVVYPSEEKVLDFRFAQGKNLLSVIVQNDGTVQFSSDFLEEKNLLITAEKNILDKEEIFLVKFNFKSQTISLFGNNIEDGKVLRKNLASFSSHKKQSLYVFKYGRQTEIKKLSYSREQFIQNYLLLIYFPLYNYNSDYTEDPNFLISREFDEHIKQKSNIDNARIYAPLRVLRGFLNIAS